MDPQAELLALLAHVEEALRQAQKVEDCRHAYELAQKARTVARDKKTPLAVRQQVACLAIEAERALGEALARMGLSKGVPGNQYSGKKTWCGNTVTTPKRLRDLGISKYVSSRSQLLAKLSREELRCWLIDQCQLGEEPSITAARQHAKSVSTPPAPHIRVNPSEEELLQPMTRREAQIELADIQKTLDRLLRRIYDGGNHKFTPAEGRLVKQRITEIGQVIRELGAESGQEE